MRKVIKIAFLFAAIAAIGVWYYVFEYSKTHHRDVGSEEATSIPASLIVKDYEANEKKANALYLNKVIELKGVILRRAKDQAGNTTVILKSGDPFANIFCTLKAGISIPETDSVIVIKGICAGFLSDVVLNEAVIVKSKSWP